MWKLARLALGSLIQQSNQELFPEGQDVGINVKPFREGSFIVDLRLFSPTHLQQIITFLTPHSIEQLNSLLQSIGLIATGVGTTTMGALQAIKFLKGKPKSVEQIGPGEFRYTSHEDTSITVAAPVHTSSGAKRLNESDLLTVDLLERQRVTGTKVQKPVYEIIKVTDYKRGSQDENRQLFRE
jgi:hypothetical protein